jgi:HSP20 family protein
MPNVRYYNNSAPFWDFVANLEGQGFNHPAFGGNRDNEATESNDNPWGQWPFQPFQHRGGRHGHRGHHGPPSPPPVPEHEAQDPPISTPDEHEAGPSEHRGPPPPFSEGPHPPHGNGPPPPPFTDGHHPHHGPGPHQHHGRARRGRCGGRGGPWGGRGNFGAPAGPPAFMQDLATMFNESLFGGNNNENDEESKAAPKSDDFKPEADVFDTEDSYVIHINLPGAKKEDVGVNWDAEKSELNVAGVIYRPGDEEFLKTLALDERKVGAFERKVRLGSRANPAQVDIEGITAKLEDGVLRVTVPKMNGEFVEVRKVDVE